MLEHPHLTDSSLSSTARNDLPAAATVPFRFLDGKGPIGFVVRSWLGLMLTLVVAGVAYDLHFNLTTVIQLYFLLVVAYALRFGFWQGTAMSIGALVCVEYFFVPPVFSFHISDRQNGIAIVVFEVAVLLVSRVSSREREFALATEAKHKTIEQLYAISRSALLLDTRIPCEQQLAVLIQEQFCARSVALVNLVSGSVGAAGAIDARDASFLADRLPANQDPDPGTKGISYRRLMTSNKQVGVLMVSGDMQALAMDSLAALISHILGRQQAQLQEGVAEAARRSEQLRTTVLDGLAHAFKTPLTIIRAASSGMLEIGGLEALQSEMMLMIDEQSIHLDDLATRLLRTARLDGEMMCLESESISVCDLIKDVVAEFEDDLSHPGHQITSSHPISFGECPEHLELTADHALLSGTLKELLSNAAKYSHPRTPIHITASDADDELVISVRSLGHAIRTEDKERIFDRFYRGDENHASAGTGIGLSVARRVTEAHGGHIWVESNAEQGTTFYMSLPK
jgi:two-component system sensor histidine kinase KdpD